MLKKFFFSLLFFVIVIIWLFQSSISTFWPQDRNLANPITFLDKYGSWTTGAKVNQTLLIGRTMLLQGINHLSYKITYFVANDLLNNPTAFEQQLTALQEKDQEYIAQIESLSHSDKEISNQEKGNVEITRDLLISDEHELNKTNPSSNEHTDNLPKNIVKTTLKENEYVVGNIDGYAGELDYALFGASLAPQQIELHSNDKVLLIGDSMQQGVGRHIRSWLQTTYKIEANNIAKQSTGFISPKNLDWNETVRNELQRNSYRLMIVLIGANDTYGLTDSNTGKIYAYGSIGWKAHYSQRVMSVLYEARSHGLDVIWILGPAMKSSISNDKIKIANQIYTASVKQYGGIIISADKALGYPDGQFEATQNINGKVKKIRSNDGTHFTIVGEQLIANAVKEHIVVNETK